MLPERGAGGPDREREAVLREAVVPEGSNSTRRTGVYIINVNVSLSPVI